jgi:putative hemolysin
MLKKKGDRIALRIGKPILPMDTAVFESASTYGRYLRAKTYALGKSFEIKREFFRRFKNHPQPEEIIPAVPLAKIMEELETGARYKLFEQSDFDVYVFPASHIPHLMREIGRLREITFRAVGEGTNRSLDLDEYDLYYDHLVVWDRVNQAFVGAYRIGNGYYINGMFGQKGFYINSLFKMKREMRSVLRKSAELGRSFVVQDYQRHRLALFLLWKGILAYLAKHKQLNYIIGPVSISNEYRELSKDLIVSFLERNCWDERLARWVKPRHPFKPHQKVVDKEALLSAVQHDVKVLDKIISDLEPKGYTMPVLLKKYLQQNAKIICFNSDHKFNDALDGFMVLNIQDLPEDLVENLKIEMVKS